MAVLALSAVGAALAPAGYAAVGWAVGSVVGQLLFPGSLPDQQGPRVGDLRAQQSQYGAAIPVVYGTARVAGNVIWSSDLLETATTQEVGGKGGPSQSQTTYSYRVSMAVMLCEGEIGGVRRIWADGKLIYNIGTGATPGSVAAGAQIASGIRVYSGSESQLADPTMQAFLGVANVPAYRGRAYVVFSDLQLEAFGNRRPNLTFEVVKIGSVADTFTYGDLPASGTYRAAAYGNDAYVALQSNSPAFVSISYDGLSWRRTADLTVGSTWLVLGFGGGEFIAMKSDTVGAVSSDGVSWSTLTGLPSTANKNELLHNGDHWLLLTDSTVGWRSTNGRTWEEVTIPGTGTCSGVWTGQQWVIVRSASSVSAYSPDGRTWTQTVLPRSGQWRAVGSDSTNVVALAQNDTNQHARSTDGGLTWSAVALVASQYWDVVWTGSYLVALAGGTTDAYAISSDGGATWVSRTQTENIGLRSGFALSGMVLVVNDSGARSVVIRFDALSLGSTVLSSVVSDICTRCRLTAPDIDVTALTDTVDGYVIGQQMSGRAAIEQLQRGFYFDAIESDSKVAFRKRGGASVMTIAADDLAAAAYGDSSPEDLSMTRQQEVELPAVVSVVYLDRDADHEQSAQQAQRITTLSTQQTAVELAISMTASRARAIAETLMYDAWTQRQKYSFTTTRAYAALEPADVVTLTRNGTIHTLRMQRKTESRSGVIQWEAVAEEASVYTQSVTGGSGPARSDVVNGSPVTRLYALDIPLLRDKDDGLFFYTAATGVGGVWRGAVLYRSADSGATYDEAGALVTAAAAGFASTALAAPANMHIFDETNTVAVELYGGSLSSAAELAVLNGANNILIGSEILQFKTATLTAANRYTLSGLLRGRRGTEWAMTTHVVGERVVFLAADALRVLPGVLNAAQLLKPVSIGRSIQETTAQSFTYGGINLDPFAPVDLGAGRNDANTITINWRRRSRLGVTLPLFYDPALGETTESYELEIWNPAFSVLRRTVTGLTTPTTTYTAVQQAADSGGVLTTYGIRVFQVSATVGRGFALQGII